MGVPGRAFGYELAEVKKAKADGAVLAKVQAANQRKLFFPCMWHLGDCIWSTVSSFGLPGITDPLLYRNEPNRRLSRRLGGTCIWEEAEGTGFDQPEEEKANRKSYCSLHLPSGKTRRRWSLILLGGVQWQGKRQQRPGSTWEITHKGKKISMWE